MDIKGGVPGQQTALVEIARPFGCQRLDGKIAIPFGGERRQKTCMVSMSSGWPMGRGDSMLEAGEEASKQA